MLDGFRLKIARRLDEARYRRRQGRRVSFSLDEAELRAKILAAVAERDGHVYLCVRNLLPAELYEAAMAYWPVYRELPQKTRGRARLTLGQIGCADLPQDVRAFWSGFMGVMNGVIKPLLVEAFMPHIDRKLSWADESVKIWARNNVRFFDHFYEGLNEDWNFAIPPHVDQKYILASALYYLPCDESQIDLGTRLYKPKSPHTRTIDIEYLDPELVEECAALPFAPNTLVAFLQSPTAFHGLPQRHFSRVRRSYQFNLVMTPDVVATIYGDDTPY
ncbi:MAG: hypothetical protein ACK4NA_14375 [Alphaproteobacteria bacterium]